MVQVSDQLKRFVNRTRIDCSATENVPDPPLTTPSGRRLFISRSQLTRGGGESLYFISETPPLFLRNFGVWKIGSTEK